MATPISVSITVEFLKFLCEIVSSDTRNIFFIVSPYFTLALDGVRNVKRCYQIEKRNGQRHIQIHVYEHPCYITTHLLRSQQHI